MTRIGWYGLGSMGLAMATNLQKHLATKNAMNLIYSNRTMARGDPLKTLGATPETSFAKLVGQCGIIFTMVSNDSVLQQLITSAIGSGHSLRDKIFVDCSTVHPETVGLTVSKLKEQQASFLAAPVFGGNPIAVDGKLVFAIAGPKKASEVVKPLIQDVMGRKVIDCGEDATKSSLLKIAGLTTGAYAPPLESRPGFGVSLAIKDANHAFAMAKEHNVELPGLKVAHENMVAAREYAGECLDSSSMYGVLRQKAGMAFWNEKSRKE
ncbi:unnamed protein product [Aspergillus oryzae RIB40]|uniref:DNA, SC012 n=1 Tax=Aspergillus oryzae (strain ATCC 42149 / RIB 40) TaxID=510516 RepID=Q2UCK5_ASPOR|nr:unnamed protein product [Aspergillus oryzae RIB40]BAE60710.1 unnamed protein product [Aspergillus oryzae RIB40]